jgi:hypothetical protein
MKKSLITLLVVTLLLVSAAPAFAAKSTPALPPERNRGAQFTLAGTITAINGSVVTVKVGGGNPIVKPFVGQNAAIQTNAQTRFLLKTATGTIVIGLADVQVGQNVSVQGIVVDSAWTATRITAGAAIIHP